VTGATKAITAGFRIMSLAVASNPIGLAVAGIALAAVLVIKYWEPIKAFFARLWDGVKAAVALSPLGPAVGGIIAGAKLIIKYWEPIKEFFSGIWNRVKEIFTENITKILNIFEPVKNLFSGIWGGVKSDFSAPAAPEYAFATAGVAPREAFQPARRNSTSTTSINAPITVNTHAGMDAKAVAKEIDNELRKRESQSEARKRGALYD
jgi:hypothetical protein